MGIPHSVEGQNEQGFFSRPAIEASSYRFAGPMNATKYSRWPADRAMPARALVQLQKL
jgi:hypothetical protein